MRKIYAIIAIATFILSACQKEIKNQSTTVVGTPQEEKMSRREINDIIINNFTQTGSFDWKEATDKMLWSAAQNSDKIFSIGYKPVTETDIDKKIASININDVQWSNAKKQVLELIYTSEREKNPSLKFEDLEIWKDKKLPVINVKIDNIKTLQSLRSLPLVRYVEPMGYDPIAEESKATDVSIFDGSGCGGYDGNTNLVNGTDYTVISPNTKVSWNYSYHGIQNAWTKATGTGIKIMVIDSGVSPDQENLGSDFNQGLSAGRTIEKIFTLPGATSADDQCGHGTTMCGEATAPRGTDGNSCGVAYNSSLVACRATRDVFIDESDEVKGVSDAYTWAGDNSTVKIISMSMGRLTSSGQIKDAINYADGKGKLMFCAGGTSFSWTAFFVGVIFPASLPNVQAVTGIKDKATQTACNDCHKGKQIDFVIVMEKTSGGLHALSTATSGDVPTTVGGSSVATSTAAGIAALVWSRFPNYTRADVINKLTTTASNYPTKNKNFGWGKINAGAATN
jgi:subtilisin family serine protease